MASDGTRYGQFGMGCTETCCGAGLMDLYCLTGETGNDSSAYFFTRCCSVGTKDWPTNGHDLDRVWGVPYSGTRPRRTQLLAKAAWENNVVFQFELSLAELYGVSWLRHFQDAADVSSRLQIPSREVSELDGGFGVLTFTGNDVQSSSSSRLVTHSGSFEARADEDQVAATFDKDYLPLVNIVATAEDSFGTINTPVSDGEVNAQVFLTDDFEEAAIIFRGQDSQNYLRALVRKTDPPIFAVQSVINGTVATIASESIPDLRTFKPGRYDIQFLANTSNLLMENEGGFFVTVTLSGETITARLFVYVNHINNNDDDISDEDVDITINTSSSEFVTETRLGMYSATAETAFIGPRIKREQSAKRFVSIYDDGVPERLAEHDVTAIFAGATGISDFERSITLIAGGESGIWVHTPVDEEDFISDTLGEFGAENFTAIYRFREIDDDDIMHCYSCQEFKKELDDSWSITQRRAVAALETYDQDADADFQFTAYPMELGYKALPTFAQHSYPKCAGWRMTNVSWEETEVPGTFDVTVTHEIIAGDVSWDDLELRLPYVDDADPEILFTYTELVEDVVLGLFEPTEDWVRRNISFISNPTTLDDTSQWNSPLRTFEADPELTAVAAVWNPDLYTRMDNKFGFIRLNPTGTPQYFDYNGDTDFGGGLCVAAPGGKVAATEYIWDGGDDPLVDAPVINRFRIYAPSDVGDPWVRFEQLNSRDPGDYPPVVDLANEGTSQSFYPLACSDLYVYVQGPAMTQPEACEFAGHQLPVIDRHNHTDGNFWLGYTWLLGWDGTTRVPSIGKGAFEPDYASRQPTTGFSQLGVVRFTQAYDCIKDSSLPYAPSFAVSEEQTVNFSHDFNNDHGYPTFFTDGLPAVAGLGATTWTAPLGCTEITVQAWGGGGGGATGYDYRDPD